MSDDDATPPQSNPSPNLGGADLALWLVVTLVLFLVSLALPVKAVEKPKVVPGMPKAIPKVPAPTEPEPEPNLLGYEFIKACVENIQRSRGDVRSFVWLVSYLALPLGVLLPIDQLRLRLVCGLLSVPVSCYLLIDEITMTVRYVKHDVAWGFPCVIMASITLIAAGIMAERRLRHRRFLAKASKAAAN